MRLHVETSGAGPLTAILLHGMMGSSESWCRVTPILVERGFRVLAVDLPGHGLSPRDAELTIERAAAAVVSTVEAEIGVPPTLAMGHSFGGLVLAAAAERLLPELAVYVDSPFRSRGGWDRAEAIAEYERDRLKRTVEQLQHSHPWRSDEECAAEARAAAHFDPASAAAVAAGSGGAWLPAPGSIVIRAEPSDYVDAEAAQALSRGGVLVRSIPGAAHSVWSSSFDDFVAALPEVFDRAA